MRSTIWMSQRPMPGRLNGLRRRSIRTGSTTPHNRGLHIIGDAGEYGQHHAACGAGGVGPGFGEAAQAGAGIAQPFGDVQQVARGAGQAVQPSDDKHVVIPHLVEQPGQFGSVALGAGQLLLIQPPAARLAQRPALERKVLVVGADAGVAEEHGAVAEVVAEPCRCATYICNRKVPGPLGAQRRSRNS